MLILGSLKAYIKKKLSSLMKYSLYKIPNNKIDFQVPSLNM